MGFYAEIEPCDHFDAIGDLSQFHRVPDDWFVVISDIRDSTPAIAQGRYKDVNMIGAACIVATLNAVSDRDIPFVFGGDGATLAVPGTVMEEVKAALQRVQVLAGKELGFTLRVGAVPVAELRRRGEDVLLARLRISPNNFLAMFAGGGVELADQLIKMDEGYALSAPVDELPDLEGLSCRWEPLNSARGRMVSLLLRATSRDTVACAEIYRAVLADIRHIMSADPLEGKPIRAGNMHFRWPPRGLSVEIRLTRGSAGWAARCRKLLLQSFIQWGLEKFDLSAGGYNAPAYREELRVNTDFRRFDGTLRIILDCDEGEQGRITEMLEERHRSGEILYGLHVAGSALMTCMVTDLGQGQHLHFVDGAEGGFALAAKGLKEQKRAHS